MQQLVFAIAVVGCLGRPRSGRAAGHGDSARAHHLDHAEVVQQLDQAVHPVLRADGLNDGNSSATSTILGAVSVHDLHHLGAGLGVGAHLDQRQLAHDGRLVGDVLDRVLRQPVSQAA